MKQAFLKHTLESDLALHASGDLTGWRRLGATWHLRFCEECRNVVEAYRSQREAARAGASELPEGLDWERLSAEISANIHVGLAAGECVTPAGLAREARVGWNWRPAAVIAGLAVVFSGAWWLNMPSSDAVALGRVLRGLPAAEDRGPVVEASAEGIEFRENGSALGMKLSGAAPMTVSLSVEGSASARYVDDAGQVIITTLYVE